MKTEYFYRLRKKSILLSVVLGLSTCASADQQGQSKLEAKHRMQIMKVLQSQTATAKSVRGEYIITANQHLQVDAIVKVLKKNSIQEIKSLGDNQILVKFHTDPGIESLRENLNQTQISVKVQPNFIYESHSPNNLPAFHQRPQANDLK